MHAPSSCARTRSGLTWTDRWHPPAEIRTAPSSSRLYLMLGGGDEPYHLNDWSFSQLCKLAGVSKDTVNKVSADTAGRVLAETFPQAASQCRC